MNFIYSTDNLEKSEVIIPQGMFNKNSKELEKIMIFLKENDLMSNSIGDEQSFGDEYEDHYFIAIKKLEMSENQFNLIKEKLRML